MSFCLVRLFVWFESISKYVRLCKCVCVCLFARSFVCLFNHLRVMIGIERRIWKDKRRRSRGKRSERFKIK